MTFTAFKTLLILPYMSIWIYTRKEEIHQPDNNFTLMYSLHKQLLYRLFLGQGFYKPFHLSYPGLPFFHLLMTYCFLRNCSYTKMINFPLKLIIEWYDSHFKHKEIYFSNINSAFKSLTHILFFIFSSF